ncbi:Glucans biosynthesis glucosyltransferase H [Bosea sp. 62]|nr:Glucans biosynthesis glucosyltransferase H [Bosea sp. 46]CAD5263862.1 Glucans biosynthesis glucosyltransferase H [Bosea sp. 21B]CAD5276434.1 Glucans biosynthesis glucosyltransferase H [Bosea sp. 7B]VVT59042.1 Glucans biosynthesis glucosyltransferase H [Bosea sp. EC-HK365B]VXB66787.1 Glucans biosynthesis glucosyltransferase H [Bosea sp. 29B]VXC07058.1 Glucans biosynthesis glucosyltransferase H [Bosea sp. 125]VXC34458.1 Glucans biosynthesis glucosyltransferase H [Bosea sp. 62]VXC77530.1 Glu
MEVLARPTEVEVATGYPAPVEATPPENRLEMPVQSFRSWNASEGRQRAVPQAWRTPWLARIFVFGGAWALTAYGAWEMYHVVSVSRTTFLQYVLLVLFTVNFSWIALAFTSAILGFSALLFRLVKSPRAETLAQKTVVVMPIYNESTARTFAAVAAIRESIEATGLGDHFDYFIVSDTTNPDIWVAEERAFLALRQRLGPDARIYYRHRPKNHHRKAGNIADFVTRWGGHYPHMVVLDADSLMTGTCIVRLAAAMEADPDAGIIQSLPLIINRNTFFARLQQFAARVYGPVIATGLAIWSGRDGNYWGHNAIIRTKAFADHCGLPDLKGKPPFGGHVLSHDFVEAALIRRAGWSVYMLPDLTGSYEESPPSLIDIATRDRRWCQGNLQHSRIIGAKGLKLSTRQHFATGMMAYLASPFWLMQLVVGILIVLQVNYARPEYFTEEFRLFPVWPRFDPERALNLFGLTMAILLAPKLFGLLLTLFDGKLRRACGGGIRLVLSALLEILFSAFFAPIMMVIQSGSVFQILVGRDTGWNPQRRDDGSIPLKDITRRHRAHTLLGLVAGLSAFMIATSLFAWMSPTIVGLLLAIPLSWASGNLALGLWLKRRGLLMTPEEGDPPAIALRANALQAEFSQAGFDDADGLSTLHADPMLRATHEAMLPQVQPRRRGEIEPDRAVAQAKLVDAETIADAVIWLKPKERMVVLHDRALLGLLANLPEGPAHAGAEASGH